MLKALKRGVQYLFSMSSRYGSPGIKIYYLLGTLYRRHGGTPLRYLVKTYAYNDPLVVQAN